MRPAGLWRHPEDVLGPVLVRVFRIGALGLLALEACVCLLEGVGDVFQEQQAEHNVFVLGGVHAAAQHVGHAPQIRFVPGRGALIARLRLWLLWSSSRHAPLLPVERHAGGENCSIWRSRLLRRPGQFSGRLKPVPGPGPPPNTLSRRDRHLQHDPRVTIYDIRRLLAADAELACRRHAEPQFQLFLRLVESSATSPGQALPEVEVDETFVGGKARHMHADRRRRTITGRGPTAKTAVLGLRKRGGHVRTAIVRNRRKATLQAEVTQHVEPGAALYSDEFKSYAGLERRYRHSVINHAVQYVDGRIHTNGLENFWSLLKRTLRGTYVHVDPEHLFRYLDEQAYRFNELHGTDASRFTRALAQIAWKRLTYAEASGRSA